jgi:pimeloyl-ACP methyl ester carboxylesterase
VRINYTESGEGHPLILVHGWGADSRRNWVVTGWVAALEPIRRVIAMDCRGHGRSDKPLTQESYGYRAMSEDVLQVMDELSIAKADLFGYSMGAFMGASLLGHRPERFTSMVLGGIGFDTEQSKAACIVIADALRANDPDQINDPVGRAYRAFVDADPTSDREALAIAALQMWPEGDPLALGGAGLCDGGVPVLIVNGANDHPYVDSAHRLAAAVPSAKFVTIPDTDHMSVVADERFRTEVLDFLGSTGDGHDG